MEVGRDGARQGKAELREERIIHIRLSDETHRGLRIRVTELDTTMQDWVSTLIERELGIKKSKKR